MYGGYCSALSVRYYGRPMEKLRLLLNSLSTDEQYQFARRCGTTIGYLRKRLSIGGQFGLALAVRIERESLGQVRIEDLRPGIDADLEYLRTRRRPTQNAA